MGVIKEFSFRCFASKVKLVCFSFFVFRYSIKGEVSLFFRFSFFVFAFRFSLFVFRFPTFEFGPNIAF